MLEAQAHSQLKTLLRQGESNWPHHLTLSRLVGRSLRRGDRTLLRLAPNQRERWWLGLLMPLCLQPSSAVLVLTAQQRQQPCEMREESRAEMRVRVRVVRGCPFERT